ncbi:MAG: redoxin domain-containing protein [Candidatus Krumholzibacteria bacterium]|nr:redoxin domain-containing protein [Candidatus Krumholzibacteria bacterium]
MKLGRFRIALALAAVLVLSGARAYGQTEASKAFKSLSDDLAQKSRMMSSYDYIAATEQAMLDFLAQYPKSKEAAQAQFTLGALYGKIGANDKAVERFAACLAAPGSKQDPELTVKARYLMGTAQMALERFDGAEGNFRAIVNSKETIDPKIRDAAKDGISKAATLRKLVIGAPAIDISATTNQGKAIRLSKDYKGKIVLLDFWATWCGPCRGEMPNVINVYNEFHGKGFEIIGVSLDNDKGKFESFVRDNGMKWPQLYDGKYWLSDYAKLYAVGQIPATFLIDRKGIIRFKNVRGERLRDAVLQLVNER